MSDQLAEHQHRQYHPQQPTDELRGAVKGCIPEFNFAQAKEGERHCRVKVCARALPQGGVNDADGSHTHSDAHQDMAEGGIGKGLVDG